MTFKELIGLGGNQEHKALLGNLTPFKKETEVAFAIGDITVSELDKISIYKSVGGILQDYYNNLGIKKVNCILRYSFDWIGNTRSCNNHFGSSQIVELMKPMISNKQSETTFNLNSGAPMVQNAAKQ